MKNIKYTILGALFACTGCVSATVSDPAICNSQSISFPVSQDLSTLSNNLPPAVLAVAPNGLADVCSNPSSWSSLQALGLPTTYTPPPQSTTTSFDFSSGLSNIDSVAKDLKVQINQLMLSNTDSDLNFVSSVEVDVQGNDTATYPSTVLATYTAPVASDAGTNAELNFDIKMDSAQVLSYLAQGPVQLTITLNSNPITLQEACNLYGQNQLSTTVYMCVAVSGSFSHSL